MIHHKQKLEGKMFQSKNS